MKTITLDGDSYVLVPKTVWTTLSKAFRTGPTERRRPRKFHASGWTTEQLDYLRDNFRHTSNKKLAKELNRTPASVSTKMFHLGLKRR